MAKPTKQVCSARRCSAEGRIRQISFGSYCVFRFYCDEHWQEVLELQRRQGKDWGSSRGRGFDARLYYASKRGFHAY